MPQRVCLKPAHKRFVSGETLPYLGRNVRIVIESGNVRSPEVALRSLAVSE